MIIVYSRMLVAVLLIIMTQRNIKENADNAICGVPLMAASALYLIIAGTTADGAACTLH